MDFELTISAGIVCYGLVKIAYAISSLVGNGIPVYHWYNGAIEFEEARDEKGWKITMRNRA